LDRHHTTHIATSVKSLALVVFLFLVVPGSGRLVFDGLPLSTRAEFAALVLCVVVFFSQELRRGLREAMAKFRWSVVVKPVLVVLCVLKFFSFAWSPLDAGFGACYRSLYAPLEDASACEKSYEAPFIQGHGLQYANVSRIERTVDFGGAPYDWSLPFMNEFPRLRDLWIERFPFSAVYSARLSSAGERFVPVRAIGEVSVSVNGQRVTQVTNYDRHFLSVVPVAAGESELLVEFSYRDTDETEPASAPSPRGPYAQLKIGEPMTATELVGVSRVLFTADLASGGVSEVAVVDRDANPVEITEVPAPAEGSLRRGFDVEFEFLASVIERSPLRVTAAGREIATITAVPGDPFSVQVTPTIGAQASAALTTERDALTALAPDARTDPNLGLTLLLVLLDLSTLLILAALAYVLIRTMRSDLTKALALAATAWLAIEPLDAILPGFVGGGRELVIPYGLIAIAIVALRTPIQRYPLAYLLPLASVLATQKILDHVHYNHPTQRANWWGKLIYYWRDSDWLTAQGNGRTIFLTGSLQGGEDVFWLHLGPRYLAFAARLLLGENDVLIGLVAITVGFIVIGVLAARFAARNDTTTSRLAATFVAFISLIFLGDQTIVAFAFFVSSEYPTWIAMLAITAFLLNPTPEHRTWVTTTLAATLAALPMFRPNIVFISLAVLTLILLTVNRTTRQETPRQLAWTVAAFAVVLPLSLIHNLYYGESFVPYTANAAINYAYNWTEIWGQFGFAEASEIVLAQLRAMMYWRVPHDPSFMIFFWGAQLIFLAALATRVRRRLPRTPHSLVALLPLAYIAPMLKFLYDSYYPRHLVAASLLCLVAGLLLWTDTTRRTSQRP